MKNKKEVEMNAKIAIALGACVMGAALCAAETNAVAEVARQVEANVVADAVEEMSPELKAWIAQMDHFIQEAGFKSEVDEKGMFRIRFGFPDERTQCVYVMPGVYEENGYKTIHVRSVAYCGNLTKAMAMQLLTTNYSLGFWQLEPCKRILASMRSCSPFSCQRMSNPKTSRQSVASSPSEQIIAKRFGATTMFID